MKNAMVVVGLGAIILIGGWWFLAQKSATTPESVPAVSGEDRTRKKNVDTSKAVIEEQGATSGSENLVTFKCSNGKTITAVFERDIVGLTLSDGRQLTLRQATSGSGIRYLSNDAAIEFRGKGNEGSLVENGKNTYAACVAEPS